MPKKFNEKSNVTERKDTNTREVQHCLKCPISLVKKPLQIKGHQLTNFFKLKINTLDKCLRHSHTFRLWRVNRQIQYYKRASPSTCKSTSDIQSWNISIKILKHILQITKLKKIKMFTKNKKRLSEIWLIHTL